MTVQTQGVDVLSGLVAEWRREAEVFARRHAKQYGYETDFSSQARSEALERAADELEVASAAIAELIEAAQRVLALPVAERELNYLSKGIGTATPERAWLDLANSVARIGDAK